VIAGISKSGEKAMMNRGKTQIAWIVALVALMMAVPISGWATPITIANYSFEAQTFAYGKYTTQSITDWTKGAGISGVWYPPTSYFPSGAPDGDNIAFLHSASISQLITATVHTGYTYTLGFDVGHCLGNPTYTVQLVAYDGTTDHVLAQSSGTSTYRSFEYLDFHYTADSTYNGDQLKIILTSSDQETDFDNITLSYTHNPTPSTFLLLGSGLMGLAFLRRRYLAGK
jgi:hypothetical protein